MLNNSFQIFWDPKRNIFGRPGQPVAGAHFKEGSIFFTNGKPLFFPFPI